MTRGPTPAPRSVALGAEQNLVGDAEYDAIGMAHYSIPTSCSRLQHLCHRLAPWLRCHTYQRGSFTVSAPHQPSMAWAGGRLLPTAVWDLVYEAAAVAMVQSGEV